MYLPKWGSKLKGRERKELDVNLQSYYCYTDVERVHLDR